MLTRTRKREQVQEFRDKFGRATSVIVADYRGIGVPAINELRSRLWKDGSGEFEYRVVKNSVLRRAIADSGLAGLSPHFEGPTAVAISYGDPVPLTKVLVEYANEHEVFELKGGYLDGRTLDRGELATLATLPSLEQLRGRLVGLLQAPATKLVRLLAEPGSQLARLVEARRAKLEQGG